MTLLEECLDVLKKYSIIEDKELEEQILSNLKSTFYGKIDFSKYADAHEINFEEIRQLPDESEYYVIWDNAAIPIIKCNIEDILEIDCQVKCNTIREKIFEAPRRESEN